MRIHFYKEDRQYFTLAEAPIIDTIIKDMKSSSETVAEQVKYAMNAFNIHAYDVLKADAKIARNHKTLNYYNDESGTIDIWVDAIVKTYNAFYMVGFFLSDAWSVAADNHDEIASRMHVRKFIESN